MNVKSVEKQEKSTVELVIEIGKEEFEAAVEKVYKKQRGKISVPGFRKGKAGRSSRACTAPACFMRMLSTTCTPRPMPRRLSRRSWMPWRGPRWRSWMWARRA